MVKQSFRSPHPGVYIRDKVIPPGMSVSDAAKLLSVSRSTLSKLLNGKSSLSPNMALRLEKVFGANCQKLLRLQAPFDERNLDLIKESITPRPYVPSFLSVRAKQIDAWPDNNLQARQLLPVLLRKLVWTTGMSLSKVDFPGYDSAERHGFDGVTIAGKSTPWVPKGECYWECSVNEKTRTKAENDYQTRRDFLPIEQRQESTFIFVTPRVWSNKATWEQDKKKIGEWKDVRVFDASDLEQWLETSIPALMWLANILDMPVDGFETLDAFWYEWSSATEPSLTHAIFNPSQRSFKKQISDWLEGKNDPLLKVSADSKEEALALLAAMYQCKAIDSKHGDLLTIINSADTLRKLASSPAPFIPIVHTDETERELATVYRERKCIVVVPRNAVESDPVITMPRSDRNSFVQALTDMNIDRSKAEFLARESGCSPTILRRRLARLQANKTPPWAKDQMIVQTLIPLALVGVWNTKSDADCEIISRLASRTPEEVEQDVSALLKLEESPIWVKGQYCGVASKMDTMYATCRWVTKMQLKKFFESAQQILSEVDPALDLPEHQRHAASLHGKVRNHSAELRASICETLVILSVHGEQLFGTRLSESPEQQVSSLVRSLLTPLSLEKLQSHDRDLPWYAEASPKEFLNVLDEDLRGSEPAMIELLKISNTNSFTSPSRTGLLWALENLAWKHIVRVCLILASLAKVPIKDNYGNTPLSSLEGIFRPWMPQTAASLEERIQTLELVMQRFPDTGWQICMKQVDLENDVAMESYRPRWRSDATGAGEPVKSEKEVIHFRIRGVELLLSRKKYDHVMLEDLVRVLHRLDSKCQVRIWTLVNKWANNENDDLKKVNFSEMIRKHVLTRWGRQYSSEAKRNARTLLDRLHVRDPVLRHSWLFQSEWIELEEDVDNDEDDESYAKRRETVEWLRTDAIKEIWNTQGFRGVEALVLNGGIPYIVGSHLATVLQSDQLLSMILRECMKEPNAIGTFRESFLKGFFSVIEQKALHSIIEEFALHAEPDESVTVFRCAPFGSPIWRLLEQQDTKVFNRYWREVDPCSGRHTDEELARLIDQLLKVDRPLAAFASFCHDLSRVETSRVKTRITRNV